MIADLLATFFILFILKIILHFTYLIKEDQLMGRLSRYDFFSFCLRYMVVMGSFFIVNKLALAKHLHALNPLRRVNVVIQVLMILVMLAIIVLVFI